MSRSMVMLRGALLLTLLASSALHAQGMFAGILQDPRTKAPLPCVDVFLEDSSAHEFAEVTLGYLRELKFTPARRASRPVCSLMPEQTFNFGLH